MMRSQVPVKVQRTGDGVADRKGGVADPTDIKRLAAYPPLACNTLTGVLFSGSANTVVNHGLGRKPVGYLVIKFVGGGQYPRWIDADERTLTLYTGAEETLDLQVW